MEKKRSYKWTILVWIPIVLYFLALIAVSFELV